jgi:L-threonylcarbamoyladenylate synthase
LQSHYAPRKQVQIGDIQSLIWENKSKAVGVLSFKKLNLPPVEKEIVLSLSGNLNEAAQKLFSALRELDQSKAEIIITELVPDTGLGRAINDRLKRAAANK